MGFKCGGLRKSFHFPIRDLFFAAGFEKMDSGLKENFPDRLSPIKGHVDGLKSLGAETGPLNPHVNAVTSNVVRVRG